jgi:NADH-quinone oxidoreductase subunit L
MYLTFFNSDRVSPEAAHHIHENPKVMTVPLWILAVGSIAGGWIGLPKLWTGSENFWERWLEPTLYLPSGHGEAAHGAVAEGAHGAMAEGAHAAAGVGEAVVHHSAALEWGAMGLSVAVAVAGILLATRWYKRETETPSKLAAALKGPYKVLLNKYFVDEIYGAAFIRPFVMAGRISWGVDRWLVDGTVNVVAYSNEVFGMLLRFFQTGYIRNYGLFILIGVLVLLYFFV